MMKLLLSSHKFGHKANGKVYCPGFVDRYDQWNNGFFCPKWGGPDRKYCCGSDYQRYCCPRENTQQKVQLPTREHIPLIIGLAVGCLVLLVMAAILCCYFCRCCWMYKRRKRINTAGLGNCVQHQYVNGRTFTYAANCGLCPHQHLFPDVLGRMPRYPMEDPPPYPGSVISSIDEKQPLHPRGMQPSSEMDTVHIFVNYGTQPDDSLNSQNQTDISTSQRTLRPQLTTCTASEESIDHQRAPPDTTTTSA